MSRSTWTLEETLDAVGASPDFLAQLEAEAIVVRREGRFTVTQVDRIRVCWNLHRELGVNLAGIEVALRLLERLEERERSHRALLERLLAERGAR